MAGDWIKFQNSTPDKPEIWAIADTLGIDPDAVVGKLLRVWIWFDEHTEKGNAPSVTKLLLDRLVGVTGFCDAVIFSGWMAEKNSKISLPNFTRHNGKTAKNRSMTALRVSNHKKKGNGGGNGGSVTNALPREEKRREENKENKQKKFVKPTPKEIQAYCDQRKNGLSGNEIFDHYEANGWVRGKTKIKDWKACVRTWEKNRTTNEDPAIRLKAI